jgi:hypothetical protein
MMKWQKDVALPVEKARLLPPEEFQGRIVTGIITRREAPEYVEEYRKLCRAAADEAAEAEADLTGGTAAEQAGNEPQ